MTNNIARDALQPKLVEHDAETVSDSSTGGSDLDDLNDKVDKLLKNADSENASQDNGAAKESKFSKLAAASAALVGLMPFMKDLYQLLVKASNGSLTPTDLADAGDRALVLGLMAKWKNESDADYWKDFASFYEIHNAGSSAAAAAGIAKEDPTSADLCLILNLTSRMFPVSPTQPFSWPTATDKVDAVKNLAATFDPSSLSGKVSFITSLAGLQLNGQALPRGVQAEIGALAVAEKVM
jgi:hypothetical protein